MGKPIPVRTSWHKSVMSVFADRSPNSFVASSVEMSFLFDAAGEKVSTLKLSMSAPVSHHNHNHP